MINSITTEILRMYGLEKLGKGSIPILLILLIGIFVALTFVDYTTDLNSSTNTNWKKDIENEIIKHEIIFRDSLESKRLRAVNTDNFISNITNKDSLSDYNNYLKYITLKTFEDENIKNIQTLKIKSRVSVSPFVEVESVDLILTVNQDKLNKIVESNSNLIGSKELIRFGDILEKNYEFKKILRYDYIAIASFALLSLMLFLFFGKKITSGKKKTSLEKVKSKKERAERIVEVVKKDIEKEEITKKEFQKIERLLNETIRNVENLNLEKLIETNFASEVDKSEKVSLELYSRSSLMLILGLLVAIIGILVFYLTIPEYQDSQSTNQYLSKAIRPALMLIFIQSISFYLLRQYRMLIKDYKYFSSIQDKKSAVYSVFQILQKGEVSEMDKILIDKIIFTHINQAKHDENTKESKEVIEDKHVSNLITKLLEKLE